jgi:phosphatidylglycerophosphatase C
VTTAPERPVVAAFDFDGTLTSGESVWKFLASVAGVRRVAVATLVGAPKLAAAALLSGRTADDAKETLFVRTLRGLSADEVARRAAAFGLTHLRRRGRADVVCRLEWHRAQGHRIAIVSASPEVYVAPVGAELGVDAVLATRLEIAPDGTLTGRYAGRNTRGAQKVARLRDWMETGATSESERADEGSDPGRAGPPARPAPTPFLWAYGNSRGDRRLLDAADIGVDVGHLGRVGRLRAFRRLAEVTSPSFASSSSASPSSPTVSSSSGSSSSGSPSR